MGRRRKRNPKKHYTILRREEVIRYAHEQELTPVKIYNPKNNFVRYALVRLIDDITSPALLGDTKLQELTWDEFFKNLDRHGLVIVVTDKNKYYKIIYRKTLLKEPYIRYLKEEDIDWLEYGGGYTEG